MLITLSCGILLSLGPVKTYKQAQFEGVYWCGDESNNVATIKLPPVQGQFMARTRDQIIEHFDFDLRPEQKGMWLWKSEIQKNLSTSIRLPQTDLPIVMTVASGQTSVQTATIYLSKIPTPMTVSYTCNGARKSTASGAGSCLALSGSESVITVTDRKDVTTVDRYVGCAESNRFTVKEDCVLAIRELSVNGERYARIAYSVKRDDISLPPPSFVGGKWLRPFMASVWQDEGNCAFAWSEKGSFSWGCR